jgi:hypothetical protein
MKVGDSRKVEASVGFNVPLQELRRHARPEDQTFEGKVRVSAEMIATLVGPGFVIKPLSPEQQTIAEGFPSVWSWAFEAKNDGEQELGATLYALVPNADKTAQQRVDSYTQKISVNVREQTWGEWFEALSKEFDAVKTIVVGLVGAATGVAGWFAYLAARRKKAVGKLTDNEGHP